MIRQSFKIQRLHTGNVNTTAYILCKYIHYDTAREHPNGKKYVPYNGKEKTTQHVMVNLATNFYISVMTNVKCGHSTDPLHLITCITIRFPTHLTSISHMWLPEHHDYEMQMWVV